MRLKGGGLNLQGLKFGRWTVEKLAKERRHGNVCWLCTCECGEQREVMASTLNTGRSRSCGCLLRDTNSEVQRTHGMSRVGSRLYSIWKGMKSRCINKRSYTYKSYGGRGITVCARWLEDFVNFYNDMNPTYAPGLTLDRIDFDKGYEPSNCRWATRAEQSKNRKSSVFVDTLEGKMYVAEAARRAGLSQAGMMSRVRNNFPIEQLLLPPRTAKRE